MNILVDVDDVLAKTLKEWVSRYNKDYNDSLKPEDFTEWSMVKFVKPECGNNIFSYLDLPDLYDNVEVTEYSLEGVEWIRSEGHRVIFVSAGIGGALAKFKWLKNRGFKPGEWGEDFVCAHDKSLIKGALLIDDRDKNVENFRSKFSILFDSHHNQQSKWPRRAKGWRHVIDILSTDFGFWNFE